MRVWTRSADKPPDARRHVVGLSLDCGAEYGILHERICSGRRHEQCFVRDETRRRPHAKVWMISIVDSSLR